MKDLFKRLDRPVVGERQLGLSDVVYEATGRLDREVREPALPEPHRPLTTGKTRQNRQQAKPAPNAPQLIRLVRTPFAVHPVQPRRKNFREKRGGRLERVPFGTESRAARAAIHERISLASPAQQRDLPQAPRPRLWQLLEEDK